MLDHAGLSPVPFCFCFGCVWHRDKGDVTVWWRCMGAHWAAVCGRAVAGDVATIWSIEPRVSARRGKCAQAKWTHSTWRVYRSVFTCLLSQVVQTGRAPFHCDSGHYAGCFSLRGDDSTEPTRPNIHSQYARDAFQTAIRGKLTLLWTYRHDFEIHYFTGGSYDDHE